MLEDRSYMRNPEFRTPSAYATTFVLIAANLVIFIFLEASKAYRPETFLSFFRYCALSTDGLERGYLWQLLTFQFLHGSRWHFVCNMFGLYLFGRSVEESLGRKHFLLLYFGSGIAGGLLQSILGFGFPSVFGLPVVGASAGIFGLIAAFAALDPNREILLFFILPMRAKHFVWIASAIASFYIIVPAEPGIAHGAHLGGIVGGWAYVHWIIRGQLSFPSWRLLRPRRRPQELIKVRSRKSAAWRQSQNTRQEDLPPAEFISKEVDPILEKISAHGIHSLTEKERKILEAARAKMQKR